MALLTISDAARVTGASRQLLHRYINTGKLSRTPDGLIDTAELLRAGFALQVGGTPKSHEVTGDHDTTVTPPVTADVTPLERLVARLEQEIAAAHTREHQYQEQIARLTLLVEQMQHRYDRLLDMPRPSPQDAPGAPQTPRRVPQPPTPPDAPPTPPDAAGDARGAMRRRIVALLQDEPEGLTPAEMQARLGVERSLTDTCQGMLRYGRLRRVGRGRYVAIAPG